VDRSRGVPRGVRVGLLLFAMFTVGLAAVLSRDPGALASEMWPAALGAVAVFSVRRRQVPLVIGLVLLLSFAAFLLGGRPLGLAVGGALGVTLEAAVMAWILTAGGTIRRAPEPAQLPEYPIFNYCWCR